MKSSFLFMFLIANGTVYAQIPEDALRYTWFPQTGTARTMAIGGASGSLGGDLSSVYANPAGLGFYRTREVVLTPAFSTLKNKSDYRQTSSSDHRNFPGFGASGLIIGFQNPRDREKSNALSIAINQTASFSNRYRYGGLNNYSSFTEQFAEELSKSGIPIQDYLYSNSIAPYTVAPAWNSFLIDTVNVNGLNQVRGASENILDSGQALMQQVQKSSSGGIYELAFSFAGNANKSWLWGLTLGVPLVTYHSVSSFTEKDTSSSLFNGFNSLKYDDNFRTTGVGVNIKVGAIYRPAEYFRIGLAIHSPSLMTLKDKRTVTIESRLESDSGTAEAPIYVSSLEFTNGRPGEPQYYQTSAWRGILSGSYVFRENEDVRKQRGFVTADIEYTNHRSSRFSSNNEEPTEDEKLYYRSLNTVVKNDFKGAFNFRVGGEVKFNVMMARLGFAHYGNPYKEKDLKANRNLFSAGLGYRNKGFFVDLTYVFMRTRDVHFPYRLEDRLNTFAGITQRQTNMIATVGYKF